jgi:acylphosphatase
VPDKRLYFWKAGWERHALLNQSICMGHRSDATLMNVSAELQVKHFLVKGRVQGVGFRWFVHREAAEIGLRGWVRNTDDGHVEVVAAGDARQIAELKAALRKGSRGSRVDDVVEHTLEDSEAVKLEEFKIEGAW